MALYMYFHDLPVYGKGGFVHSTCKEWHVGDKLVLNSVEVRHLEYIEANGNELDCILSNFIHIPYHRDKKPMIWYGDMAKFIMANMT